MALPPPPRPNRKSMFDDIKQSSMFSDPSNSNKPRQSNKNITGLFGSVEPKKEDKGNGLFDIPVLGKIIDTLDTARAGIVSGVKEVGDIFDSDNSFSVTEWYDQTKDNIMMGEVLRDCDVDLPGPLDFVVGLGLDIALDPLTYLYGAGIAVRFAKAADVALALKKASSVASKAGDVAKAARLEAAAGRVNRTKSVLSAGSSLDEIGMSSGMRFAVPGTGRFGRTIIEKPLRKLPGVGKKLGNKLDDLRVKQLTQVGVGPGGIFKYGDEGVRAFDLTNENNIKLVRAGVRHARGLGPKPAIKAGSVADAAVKRALKMAVEAPGTAKAFAKIPGSLGFVTSVASGPGRVFAQVADTSLLGGSFAKAFDTNRPINKLIRSRNPVEQDLGRGIQRTQRMGNTAAARWQSSSTQGQATLKAKLAGTDIDYDDLMLNADNTPEFLRAQGSKYGVEGTIEFQLIQEARDLMVKMRKEMNEALPFTSDYPDLAGELYMMKYLSQEGAETLKKAGKLRGKFNPDAAEDSISGNSFKARKYLTPSGIKQTIFDLSGKINKDVVSGAELRKQLGIRADASDADTLATLDLALAQGVTIRLRDGRTVSNKTSFGTFTDEGSIRFQMETLGKKAFGDDWKEIFSTDFTQAMARYIDQTSRFIRSQYVVDGLAQRGIIAYGVDGQLARAAATRLAKEMDAAKKTLSKANLKKIAAETEEQRIASLVVLLEKNVEDLNSGAVAALQGRGVKGIQQAAESLVGDGTAKVIGSIAKIDAEISVIDEVIAAILTPGVKIEGMSDDALNVIRAGGTVKVDGVKRPSSLKNPMVDLALKTNRSTAELARLTTAREDAVEMLNILNTKITELKRSSDLAQQALVSNPSQEGLTPLLEVLTELNSTIASLKQGTANLQRNYVDSVLKDFTVIAYDDLIDWLNVRTADNLYDLGKDGSVVVKKLTKAGDERLSMALGKEFGPEYDEWAEQMDELIRLKHEIGNIDADDLSLLSRGKSLLSAAEDDLLEAQKVLDDALRVAENKSLQRALDTTTMEPGFPINVPKKVTSVQTTQNEEVVALLLQKKRELQELTGSFRARYIELETNLKNQRAELIRRKANNETVLSVANLGIDQQQQLLQNLRLEKTELLSSTILSRRISAADSQAAAVKELQTVRAMAGLSDAYGNKLNNYMVNMSGLGKLSIGDVVSTRTQELLGNYNLVGEASDETVELFAAAVEAAAKTQDTVAMGKFMKEYGRYLNWWKAQAISTPGFILRNMMGGFWMNNQLADVPMSVHQRVMGIRRAAMEAAELGGQTGDVAYGIQQLIDAGKPVRLKGKLGLPQAQGNVQIGELQDFRDWYRTGIASSGQVSQEVVSKLDNAGIDTWRNAFSQGTISPFDADFKPFALVRRANQDAEFMMRGALAHHIKTSGGSIEDAFEAVNKYHFDYANLTNTERIIKQVIPFYTWQKNVIPVLVESIGKNPTAWGRLAQVKKELELNSPAEGLFPSFFGENMGVRLPFKFGDDRVYALPDLPFRDLAKWTKGFEDGNYTNMTELTRPLYESAVPFIKLPIELKAGKRMFSDIPFSGRYQQVPAWGKIPGLLPALSLKGWAKKNSKGEWKMTDRSIYKVEQMLPWFGRIARLIPNEKGKQERLATTWVSTVFGTNIRANTASSKRNEKISRDIKKAQDKRDLKDLENRVR